MSLPKVSRSGCKYVWDFPSGWHIRGEGNSAVDEHTVYLCAGSTVDSSFGFGIVLRLGGWMTF